MRCLVAVAVLAGLAAGVPSLAPSASAACPRAVQAPSVSTVGGVSVGGPYVEACGSTCTRLVTTPAQSVPGVAAVGPAYVNNCL